MSLLREILRETLGAISAKHGKRYCYPSVATIQANILKHWGFTWSQRQISRVLKIMEEGGDIERKRRVRHLENGQWRQLTTLYKIGWTLIKFSVALYYRLRWTLNRLRVTKIPFHHTSLQSGSKEKPPPHLKYLTIKSHDGSLAKYYPVTGQITPIGRA